MFPQQIQQSGLIGSAVNGLGSALKGAFPAAPTTTSPSAGPTMASAAPAPANTLQAQAVIPGDEVIPLQDRIESVGDDADLQEVYDTERHLLYVACTRTRDHLLVTSVEPASEFLDDLRV
jgi:hypothetical protein